jgi:hypothetical protein
MGNITDGVRALCFRRVGFCSGIALLALLKGTVRGQSEGDELEDGTHVAIDLNRKHMGVDQGRF